MSAVSGGLCDEKQNGSGSALAFCFPDTYEVGMSHLGSRILYGLLNDQNGIRASAFFAPWIDIIRGNAKGGYPVEARKR